jgi:hypothetical protein
MTKAPEIYNRGFQVGDAIVFWETEPKTGVFVKRRGTIFEFDFQGAVRIYADGKMYWSHVLHIELESSIERLVRCLG